MFRAALNCWCRSLSVLLCTGVLLAFCSACSEKPAALSTERPPSMDQIEEAVRLGGKYLTRSVDQSGKFEYEYDPTYDRPVRGYNLLRHAGTTFSMVEVYEYKPDPDLRQAIERAIEYLKRTAQPGIGDPAVGQVVVEDAAAKLGGSGLSVLALATYTAVMQDSRYLALARELARGISAFQEPSGKFRSKWSMTRRSWDSFESEYYPGEAIYGLMRLAEVDPDPKLKTQWRDIATRAAQYLIRERDRGKPIAKLPHDHWLLYGLNELHLVDPQTEYLEHTKKLVQAIVSSQNRGTKNPSWEGSYYTPPRSTPTSTRNEGLCAAYQLAKRAGDPVTEQISDTINRGLRYQLANHIGQKEATQFKNPVRAVGGVRESLNNSQIRIDYVQHSLSALLCWRKQLLPPH